MGTWPLRRRSVILLRMSPRPQRSAFIATSLDGYIALSSARDSSARDSSAKAETVTKESKPTKEDIENEKNASDT